MAHIFAWDLESMLPDRNDGEFLLCCRSAFSVDRQGGWDIVLDRLYISILNKTAFHFVIIEVVAAS